MNVTAGFPVTDPSEIGAPRRAALWLANQLAYSEERAGRAAIVVSELATNLVKHARGGEILIRKLSTDAGEPAGMEIVAVDSGPGLRNTDQSRTDGFSTSGTLGHGLGAIERQSDRFDIYTGPSGTAIVAAVCRDPQPHPGAVQGRYDLGAVHVSKPGEEICGDEWSWRVRDSRLAILVADGLGHGLHAHDAAAAAVAVFARQHEQHPAALIEDVHAALKPTRGAAVAMLAIDLERRIARYAGLGNISAAILPPAGSRQSLVSHNGTAGHTAARIQEFQYPIPPDSVIVMTSDGITTQWDLAPYPGIRFRRASTIAAVLYRDFSRRRDDVTIVVAKEHPAIAEKL